MSKGKQRKKKRIICRVHKGKTFKDLDEFLSICDKSQKLGNKFCLSCYYKDIKIKIDLPGGVTRINSIPTPSDLKKSPYGCQVMARIKLFSRKGDNPQTPFVVACNRNQEKKVLTCQKCEYLKEHQPVTVESPVPNDILFEVFKDDQRPRTIIQKTETKTKVNTMHTEKKKQEEINPLNTEQNFDPIFEDPLCPVKPFVFDSTVTQDYDFILENNLLKLEKADNRCRICKETELALRGKGKICYRCDGVTKKETNNTLISSKSLVEALTKCAKEQPDRAQKRSSLSTNKKKKSVPCYNIPLASIDEAEREILDEAIAKIKKTRRISFYQNVKDIFDKIEESQSETPLQELLEKLKGLNEPY